MRKVKSVRPKAGGKSPGALQTVEQYVATLPENSRVVFNELRAAVRSAVPRDAEEIISYRIPAFRREVVLVWFAAFSDHCSLFPTSSVIARFKGDLKAYSTSKGTIHFPLDRRLPLTLIKRIVKARVAEVCAKSRG
jgi:uncharacterized protein YdhG (YjbR/CyaY superfamily)